MAILTACQQAGDSVDKETIYQVSLLQGLTLGDYHGSVSAIKLKEKGDVGIGTFDGLNGELVMVDGVIYRVLGNGSVEIPDNSETILFSDVTFFDADSSEHLSDVKTLKIFGRY